MMDEPWMSYTALYSPVKHSSITAFPAFWGRPYWHDFERPLLHRQQYKMRWTDPFVPCVCSCLFVGLSGWFSIFWLLLYHDYGNLNL